MVQSIVLVQDGDSFLTLNEHVIDPSLSDCNKYVFFSFFGKIYI